MSVNSDIATWVSGNIDIIKNISENMVPVQKLVTGFAYIAGLLFAFKAIFKISSFCYTCTGMLEFPSSFTKLSQYPCSAI